MIQHRFRTQYDKDPPSQPKIYSWHQSFVRTSSSISHAKSLRRPSVADAVVKQVRGSYARSLTKSKWHASRETGIPQSNVWCILRIRHLKPYRFTIMQHITDADKIIRWDFCAEMLGRIEENETLLNHIIFSDESTFHSTDKVNTRNCRIWGFALPHVHLQHVLIVQK